MRSALYYPYTRIESIDLVKIALLLWDRVEYIVPYPGYRANYDDPLVAEAMEIVGEGHSPTNDELTQAHKLVEELVTGPLPEPFYLENTPTLALAWQKQSVAGIHYEKLLPETWRMLEEAHLTGPPPGDSYLLSVPTGLSVMSILADCCAGSTRQRVTDQSDAYATLTRLIGNTTEAASSDPEASVERLVPITLDVIGANVDLRRLVDLRKREDKPGGHVLRDLRHRYLDRLEWHVTKLTTVKGTVSDRREVMRQFTDEIKDDAAFLRDELKVPATDVLTSKEVLVAAIAGIGTLASWALGVPNLLPGVVTAVGAPVMIGGLLGLKNRYGAARRAVLQKHPTAYLFAL